MPTAGYAQDFFMRAGLEWGEYQIKVDPMQTSVPDSIIRVMEQIKFKKAALVRLLLHLNSVRLESKSLPKVQEEFDWYAKQERDLTQEIDLTGEKTKEELIAILTKRRQVSLESMSFQDLTAILPLPDETSS